MTWCEVVHHGAVKRVWLPEKDTPGLAMSRSFGDAIGATVGVIAEPTVTKWQLTPDHRFAILATDGVWEFISSQEAVDLVGRALDAPRRTGHDAAYLLATEASRRWEAHEGCADDITVVILLFDCERLASDIVC